MKVIDFDHIVLNVADVERSLTFYTETLGLAPVRVAEWRAGRVPFPSVRVSAGTIIDLLHKPRQTSNVDHFCLVVEPLDWPSVIASGPLKAIEGPVSRFGARGEAQSIYIEDPDQNVIELRYYLQASTA